MLPSYTTSMKKESFPHNYEASKFWVKVFVMVLLRFLAQRYRISFFFVYLFIFIVFFLYYCQTSSVKYAALNIYSEILLIRSCVKKCKRHPPINWDLGVLKSVWSLQTRTYTIDRKKKLWQIKSIARHANDIWKLK